MQEIDIDAMAELLEERRPAKVLEYGAGASSLYWLQRYPFIKTWVAIEHNPEWAGIIEAQAPAGLEVVCTPEREWSKYVTPPMCHVPFDLIIVDGIHRVECVKESVKYLAANGAVLLHDADRLVYGEVYEVYPHYKHITRGNTPDGLGGMKRDGLLLMWGGK